TRALVSAATRKSPRKASETVFRETPARAATVVMETGCKAASTPAETLRNGQYERSYYGGPAACQIIFLRILNAAEEPLPSGKVTTAWPLCLCSRYEGKR